jgi:hypothetical protein
LRAGGAVTSHSSLAVCYENCSYNTIHIAISKILTRGDLQSKQAWTHAQQGSGVCNNHVVHGKGGDLQGLLQCSAFSKVDSVPQHGEVFEVQLDHTCTLQHLKDLAPFETAALEAKAPHATALGNKLNHTIRTFLIFVHDMQLL